MTPIPSKRRRLGALAAAILIFACAGAAEGPSTRILSASDNVELTADVAAEGLVRVALLGDRIARVIRTPGGFAVEHDAGTGDLYLQPLPDARSTKERVDLFVGTEKGFTYRLILTPSERGSAQILIRNPDAESAAPAPATAGNARIPDIARLMRAVAKRVPPAGYVIEPGGSGDGDAEVIEVWRGPRYEARVLDLGAGDLPDAQALAARLGSDVAAVWIAEPGDVSSHGRVAVAVREVGAR